jgi:hypothetical protein
MIRVRDAMKPFVRIDQAYPDRPWQIEQRRVEQALSQFLGITDGDFKVIFTNRESSAALALFVYLKEHRGAKWFNLPPYYYESIPAAARLAGLIRIPVGETDGAVRVRLSFGGCSQIYPQMTCPGCTSDVDEYVANVYDCAQSCYRGMLRGVVPRNRAFLLSFESSKPQGGISGGGAVVVPAAWEDDVRVNVGPRVTFANPRTEQCLITLATVGNRHQQILNDYFNLNISIHRELNKLLTVKDFSSVSGARYNPTPIMCVLKPTHGEALSRLLLASGGRFEVKACYGGLIAVPTYSWNVVELIAQEYSTGAAEEADQ